MPCWSRAGDNPLPCRLSMLMAEVWRGARPSAGTPRLNSTRLFRCNYSLGWPGPGPAVRVFE